MAPIAAPLTSLAQAACLHILECAIVLRSTVIQGIVHWRGFHVWHSPTDINGAVQKMCQFQYRKSTTNGEMFRKNTPPIFVAHPSKIGQQGLFSQVSLFFFYSSPFMHVGPPYTSLFPATCTDLVVTGDVAGNYSANGTYRGKMDFFSDDGQYNLYFEIVTARRVLYETESDVLPGDGERNLIISSLSGLIF